MLILGYIPGPLDKPPAPLATRLVVPPPPPPPPPPIILTPEPVIDEEFPFKPVLSLPPPPAPTVIVYVCPASKYTEDFSMVEYTIPPPPPPPALITFLAPPPPPPPPPTTT